MYRIDEKKNKIVEDLEIKRLPANSHLRTKPVVTLLSSGTIKYYFTYVATSDSGALWIELSSLDKTNPPINFKCNYNFDHVKKDILSQYCYLSENTFDKFWLKLEADYNHFKLECEKAFKEHTETFIKIRLSDLSIGEKFYWDETSKPIEFLGLRYNKRTDLPIIKVGPTEKPTEIQLASNDYVYIKKI